MGTVGKSDVLAHLRWAMLQWTSGRHDWLHIKRFRVTMIPLDLCNAHEWRPLGHGEQTLPPKTASHSKPDF